jgi:hypothetical protein
MTVRERKETLEVVFAVVVLALFVWVLSTLNI